MTNLIKAWLPLDHARIMYTCKKPKGWDKLKEDEKMSYFEENMEPTNEMSIYTTIEHNWYDSIDPAIDFEEG